jgi:hypothetical protein
MDFNVQLVDPEGVVHSHRATEAPPIDEAIVVAKSCGNGVYFVRATAEGALFNPAEGDRLTQKDRERSGARFKLHRCGVDCFMTYVRYLQGRQRPDYSIAQRGFVDGK